MLIFCLALKLLETLGAICITLTIFCSVMCELSVQFSSVIQSCLFSAITGTAAHHASLSITKSWSLPKLMSIELVMPSNHLILCYPVLLLPSIFPRITIFSKVSSSHQVAKVLEFQLQHQSFQCIRFPLDLIID